MDDAVKKEHPKTYSLEEILDCTKKDSEDIFPLSEANDWHCLKTKWFIEFIVTR